MSNSYCHRESQQSWSSGCMKMVSGLIILITYTCCTRLISVCALINVGAMPTIGRNDCDGCAWVMVNRLFP